MYNFGRIGSSRDDIKSTFTSGFLHLLSPDTFIFTDTLRSRFTVTEFPKILKNELFLFRVTNEHEHLSG